MLETAEFSRAFGLYQRGAFTAAIAAARALLGLQGTAGQTMHLIALASHQLGRNDHADLWLRRAAPLLADGDLIDALANRGSILLALGRRREALESAARAQALAPGKARALCVRAAVLRAELLPAQAIAAARQAVALEPALGEAWTALANALQAAGRAAEAVDFYARAIVLDPNDIVAHGNRLFTLSFAAGTDDRRTYEAARAWAARIEAQWPPTRPRPRIVSGRRIRIGYHSFEFFRRSAHDDNFPPLLRNHDRGRFEIVLLGDGGRYDARTAELQRLADRWIDLMGLDLAAKVERMRAAELDIAACLTGYLAIHRVVFAPRVAPVQVALMNQIGTMGLRAFDYRVTDRWLDPEDQADAWNVEKLVRLEAGYQPFAPIEDAPPMASLPALENGFVTFGSFNNLTKITQETLAAWARIIERVPGSRLLLKARALEDDAVKRYYLRLAAAHGLDPGRVDLLGDVSGHDEHLQSLGRADIALDPIPFTGGRSSVEALWMGVPVVTLTSPSFAGRIGASLLSRGGLAHLVARTAENYVAVAARLAGDLEGLRQLRAGLRDRLLRSPLCDARAYSRELESAYEAMLSGRL